MFTGLVETVGTVKNLRTSGNYRLIAIAAGFEDDVIIPGESIACDGACLTVVSLEDGVFNAQASQETLNSTIIGGYKTGSKINLERALKVGDRMGGHFVTGHIDTTATVNYVRMIGQSLELEIAFDSRFDRLVVEKGSIAINGVSLTINSVRPGWCNVNLIPYTAEGTTLGLLKRGHPVNLEFDMIGKYILKMQNFGGINSITKEKLLENGW